jgi:hypothetical protein
MSHFELSQRIGKPESDIRSPSRPALINPWEFDA